MAALVLVLLCATSLLLACLPHSLAFPTRTSATTSSHKEELRQASACYGTVDTDLELDCPEGEVISVKEILHGAKPRVLNCTTPEYRKNFDRSCCRRQPRDCVLPLVGEMKRSLVAQCSGLTSCVTRTTWTNTNGHCDSESYLPQTNYMYISYTCQPGLTAKPAEREEVLVEPNRARISIPSPSTPSSSPTTLPPSSTTKSAVSTKPSTTQTTPSPSISASRSTAWTTTPPTTTPLQTTPPVTTPLQTTPTSGPASVKSSAPPTDSARATTRAGLPQAQSLPAVATTGSRSWGDSDRGATPTSLGPTMVVNIVDEVETLFSRAPPRDVSSSGPASRTQQPMNVARDAQEFAFTTGMLGGMVAAVLGMLFTIVAFLLYCGRKRRRHVMTKPQSSVWDFLLAHTITVRNFRRGYDNFSSTRTSFSSEGEPPSPRPPSRPGWRPNIAVGPAPSETSTSDDNVSLAEARAAQRSPSNQPCPSSQQLPSNTLPPGSQQSLSNEQTPGNEESRSEQPDGCA